MASDIKSTNMKKTLGGDRLGTGQKEKIELHNYGRSTHDLSYVVKTTGSFGTIIPIACEVLLPKDEVDIELDIRLLTGPTVGPEFASAKVEADFFTADARLYNRQLHNNKLNMGLNMDKVKLPVYELFPEQFTSIQISEFTGNPDNISIHPSCVLRYLGNAGVGISVRDTGTTPKRAFDATGWLAYCDLYKNYYANKQEKEGAVIHTPAATLVQEVNGITVDGNALSQAPNNSPLILTVDEKITITINGGQTQPLNQILLNTDRGIIYADEAGAVSLVSTGPDVYEISYDFSRYGNRTVFNWNYADSRTLRRGKIQVQRFDLDEIDQMREAILGAPTNVQFKLNDAGGAPNVSLAPWSFILNAEAQDPDTWLPRKASQEGLLLKTYLSDLFNNWLDTEWLDGAGGLNELTAVTVVDDKFTIPDLITAEKLYDAYQRVVIAGNSYDDYMDVAYDDNRYSKPEIPVFHGGLIKELVFEEVVSMSESTAENGGVQPLGTLGGRGKLGEKHKGGHITIKANEICYMLGVIHVTPRLDYSQGNQWHIHLKTLADYRIPGMDGIGFQELIAEQMAWWSTWYDAGANKWVQVSAGKQPAWQNYRTNVNRVFGKFAEENEQMWMVMTRRYTAEKTDYGFRIDDLTTYIDPEKFNWIFAQTELDSENLWIQVKVNMKKRMLGSATIIPNL